jgi:Fibrinogen beta and gamma chains, C-terminal globular domain
VANQFEISSCSESNLNGRWFDSPNGHNFMGIIWEKWLGDYSLAKTRMLIRPKELWFNSEEDEAPLSPPDDP